MIIQFKRFFLGAKITSNVEIPLVLNLTPRYYTGHKYKFSGLIYHIGNDFKSGHYTALLDKSLDPNIFTLFYFNDSEVYTIDDPTLPQLPPQRNAYLLFYRLIKENECIDYENVFLSSLHKKLKVNSNYFLKFNFTNICLKNFIFINHTLKFYY